MKIPNGLSFQIEVSSIDLNNVIIPVSKINNFSLSYYTGTVPFIASRINNIFSHCELKGDVIVVTIDAPFDEKGVVKCKMEIEINDFILPLQPFKFNCPEQKTDIEII